MGTKSEQKLTKEKGSENSYVDFNNSFKKMTKIFIFSSLVLLILIIYVTRVSSVNLVCSEDFCETYKTTTGCTTLNTPCRAQNSTLNGRIFSSHTACGCCQLCLENLSMNSIFEEPPSIPIYDV